jgi:hypothetical protein
MSPKIPGTRHCVAPSGAPIELQPSGAPTRLPPSCSRIDLQPSVRAATVAGAWLLLICAVVLASVASPLLARIGICLSMATPLLAAVRTSVLLRGDCAVRGLQWSGGAWQACVGPDRIQTPVTLRVGSFRVGRAFLLLWLESRDGIHALFIDVGRQEPRAMRRLCRQLIASKPKV